MKVSTLVVILIAATTAEGRLFPLLRKRQGKKHNQQNQSPPNPQNQSPGPAHQGPTTSGCVGTCVANTPDLDCTLTETQLEGIVFMREEEKLARDVYLAFSEEYVTERTFRNIARAEQKHMDSMLNMINLYDLTDPIIDENEEGEFMNQDLETLYEELLEKGATVEEAIKVGVKIEVTDILDLQDELANLSDACALYQVYNSLLDASMNHLNAFKRNLVRKNIDFDCAEEIGFDQQEQCEELLQ